MGFRYGLQWLAAVRLALSRIHCQESYGRSLKSKRRLEWHRQKIRRQMEWERTNEMLLAEKMVELPEYPELGGLTKTIGFSTDFGRRTPNKQEI